MYHNFKNLIFEKADNENMHFSRNKKNLGNLYNFRDLVSVDLIPVTIQYKATQ